VDTAALQGANFSGGPDARATDPREMLLGHLDWYRDTLVRKLEGLPEERLRAPVEPLTWSPLSLVKHLGWAERRWMRWGFAAEDVPSCPPGGEEAEWRIAGEETVDDIMRSYREEVRLSRALAHRAGVEERARVGGRFRVAEEAPTLERTTRRTSRTNCRPIRVTRLPRGCLVTGHRIEGSAVSVTSFQDLPLADRDRAWDGADAEKRVRDWAGAHDDPNDRYRDAHLWYDGEQKANFGSYKLLIAEVVDGRLVAVPRGVMAAAAVMQGARGSIDRPRDDIDRVKRHLSKYYAKMQDTAPCDG
jgi:hypothetical protein